MAETRPAALLVSDISGFTSLTERLEARGREGAEEISALVSAGFRPAIRSIEQWGGSIVAFGGDALFALFLGGSRVRRAAAAAEEIRAAFARRPEVPTSVGTASLGISPGPAPRPGASHGYLPGLRAIQGGGAVRRARGVVPASARTSSTSSRTLRSSSTTRIRADRGALMTGS